MGPNEQSSEAMHHSFPNADFRDPNTNGLIHAALAFEEWREDSRPDSVRVPESDDADIHDECDAGIGAFDEFHQRGACLEDRIYLFGICYLFFVLQGRCHIFALLIIETGMLPVPNCDALGGSRLPRRSTAPTSGHFS